MFLAASKRKLNWQGLNLKEPSLLTKQEVHKLSSQGRFSNSVMPSRPQLFFPSALSPSAHWLLTVSVYDCEAAAAALGITATFKGKAVGGEEQKQALLLHLLLLSESKILGLGGGINLEFEINRYTLLNRR